MRSATRNLSAMILAGLGLAAFSTNAAAEDVWLSCSGTVETTGETDEGESLNASEDFSKIYAYNDELNGFYLYNEDKAMLSPVYVQEYTPELVTWSGEGSFGARWNGSYDRGENALSIVRTDDDKRMEWTGTCTPTNARPLGEDM